MESQTNRIQDQQGLIGNVVRQMQEFSSIMSTQSERISTLQAELITLKNPAERARLTEAPKWSPVRGHQVRVRSTFYHRESVRLSQLKIVL